MTPKKTGPKTEKAIFAKNGKNGQNRQKRPFWPKKSEIASHKGVDFWRA